MSDSAYALEKAFIGALKADSAVSAIVGAQVYDVVPAGVQKPYITIGTAQVLPEHASCYVGSDVAFTIDGWSAGPASIEIKKLGKAIRDALDQVTLALDDNQRLVNIAVEQSQYLKDPDGITQHVAVTFMARTEPSV